MAENENPEAQVSEKVYNVEIKFGDRCDEWCLALARGIVERLNIGNIMMVMSFVDKNLEVFNLVTQFLAEKLL